MRSWFSTKSTVITLTVKTTDGNLEDKIQIQSDESVRHLKTLIDKKFKCDPELQKLVFHGQELSDETLLSTYKIIDNSIILLMDTNNNQPSDPPSSDKPLPKPQRRSIFDKANPFYQRHSGVSEPGQSSNNKNSNDPKYFDPILNKLAEYHPELPMAVMSNARPIGDLMKDLNKKFEQENAKLNEEQQSLAAYYYYLSLASLSAATKTVASSVYQRLPTKEEISSSIQYMMPGTDSESTNNDSITRPSLSWMQHLQKLVRNTKEEKAGIDRLVSLGFNRRESVEAYLACDKDEALAALFMSQNKTETETKGNDDDVSVDASIGYINNDDDKALIHNSVYFKQFQMWMRGIFDDDELYYRYVLLFMKQKIADMSCLEDINYDEEFLMNIGIEHRIHRKRIIKAIGLFVNNRNKFHVWWNGTIQFKKYLQLFQKYGIWDLEELLLQIRTKKDIMNIIGMKNKDDVEFIWKHINHLRKSHSLYSDTKETAHCTANAYDPNEVNMYTPNVNMNYSAPPIHGMDVNDINIDNMGAVAMDNNDSQKEGAMTQI